MTGIEGRLMDDVTWTVRTTGDPEIDAMHLVTVALQNLDPKARERVSRWAISRYEIEYQ